MSIESLALWGCARGGALDIWNNCRVYSYMRNCGTSTVECTSCDAVALLEIGDDLQNRVRQGPGVVGTSSPGANTVHLPAGTAPTYTTPALDNAWWYDPLRPESAGFFGLEVIRVSGLYESTRKQTVTVLPQNGCATGLLYADPIDEGYEIVVEGILHGATCCAVRYGYLALKKALRGCCGSNSCGGTALRYLPCVPSSLLDDVGACTSVGTCDLPTEDTGTISPWRFVRNARILDEPAITKGAPDGSNCKNNCGCSPDTWVKFIIRAEAGQFSRSTLLIDESLVVGTESCVTDISICDCTTTDPLNDPDCPIPAIPAPPNAASSCYCPIFSTDRKCFEFTIPQSIFDAQLEFHVDTKSGPLKNFRVAMWKKIANLDFSTGVYDKCNQCGGFGITPLPAGTKWDIGCNGVTVSTPGRGAVNANRTLLGSAGAPAKPCFRISCGTYIMCVYTDPSNTPADATLTVSYRWVEP